MTVQREDLSLICFEETVSSKQEPSTVVMDSKTGLLYIPRGLNMSTEMLLYNSLINSCIAVALPTPQLNVHCDAHLDVKSCSYLEV
ncbi:hypothetical protein BGX24_010545 [Mortierella sp. AD032]|nr:hypothetical protein BGX24_010545 [Mortierella sp. AD032]